ncbi:hypothetical protein ACFL5O_04150 [Myxococcota bacterium]
MIRSIRPAPSRLPMFFVLAALVAVACSDSESAEPSDQCRGLQSYDSVTGTCVCPTEHVLQDGTCQPCGANEEPSAESCVCTEGFSREDSSGSCEPTDTTASTSEPLTEHTGQTGTDTTASTGEPLTEHPEQTGVDTPCQSEADCADFDANYCELMVSSTCLVKDCDTTDPNACSEGHHCCDFAAFGLPSLCISAALSGGVCV